MRIYHQLETPSRLEVVRLLSVAFAGVYEHESLSLWESRALRPGEGGVRAAAANGSVILNNVALPGRYRVRPSRREGEVWQQPHLEQQLKSCTTSKR